MKRVIIAMDVEDDLTPEDVALWVEGEDATVWSIHDFAMDLLDPSGEGTSTDPALSGIRQSMGDRFGRSPKRKKEGA